MPTVTYDQVMSDNVGLMAWLENIVSVNLGRCSYYNIFSSPELINSIKYEWGFSLVKGVPVTPEATKSLIERIAFIRHTHYGILLSDLPAVDVACC